MMKTQTLPISTSMILVVGLLVLAGAFFVAHPALAQPQEACSLPDDVAPPPALAVTAQQVEDGSATLREFGLETRNFFSLGTGSRVMQLYVGCTMREDGNDLHSGSTYLVQLTPDGRVFVHSKNMALSGRLLNRLIYGAILQALGISLDDLQNPAAITAAFMEAAGRDGGEFNVPHILGASGYATVYLSQNFSLPMVLLAGFDLNESHLAEEEFDFRVPAVTARDVVDRETLKAFVTNVGELFLAQQKGGNPAETSKGRVALRAPNGPYRHGSVYLYILDLTSDIVLLHGAFPDRFELRPLVGIARDGVTGELILPQVLEAAKSNPEGGFVEYFYDDPTDDTDSADIPKVGYARQFIGERTRADGTTLPVNFIVGSGFYVRVPEVVSTVTSAEVEATVLGDAVEGLTVEFSRAIAGHPPNYVWSAVTDANGHVSLTISSAARRVSGYYRAQARNADGEVVGQWHSIPLNHNRRQVLELPLDGDMRLVRVEPLAAAKAVATTSGLAPNVPNPFNSATQIAYHLSSPGPVQLVIYNVLGQPVRTLVDQFQAAGSYQIQWDARDQRGVSLSSGVYITRLSYPGGEQTQRLLYLK